MKKLLLGLGVLSLSFLLVLPARGSDPKSAGETAYMVVTSHTPEECLRDLDAIVDQTPEILANVQWGCGSGVHTGWMIVTAKDEAEARRMLPSSMREDAEVVSISKFTAEQIKSYHKKK